MMPDPSDIETLEEAFFSENVQGHWINPDPEPEPDPEPQEEQQS